MRRNSSLASRMPPSKSQTKIPMMSESTRRRIFASRSSISPCNLANDFKSACNMSRKDAQVRDRPQLDMRVLFPCFVLTSVRDEQRLTRLHDGIAIRSRIESAPLARISFGRAGDENFDVGRIDPHYGGRGHVHDLGKEIHKLLPFSDD